jgi:hypothetical protein
MITSRRVAEFPLHYSRDPSGTLENIVFTFVVPRLINLSDLFLKLRHRTTEICGALVAHRLLRFVL